MIKKTLEQLYAEHQGKVSDKWSSYLLEYERIFEGIRSKPINMLEIGVQNGGSLEIWASFFPEATTIIGCDINPDCAKLKYENPKIYLFVGDANQEDSLTAISKWAPNLDIVIDDGSHRSSDIIRSFCLYFPRLNPGGIFIAEDLHCSYWRPFEGGIDYEYSSMSFFKQLVDLVNWEHWTNLQFRTERLKTFNDLYGCFLTEKDLACIHSIEFVNSMCIIRKANSIDNRLGRRVIVGNDALVVTQIMGLKDQEYQLDQGLIEKPTLFQKLKRFFR